MDSEIRAYERQLQWIEQKRRREREEAASLEGVTGPILEAKREVESEQRILESLRLKVQQERVNSAHTTRRRVNANVVDRAESPTRPIRRWMY